MASLPQFLYVCALLLVVTRVGLWLAQLAAYGVGRVPLPLASLLRDRFLTLLARGGEHLDWSAIGGLAATDAGCTRS